MQFFFSQSLQERFFEYDIFPSYDSSDQDWVTQYLMSELEDRQELRLCIHPRDFVPGLFVVDNIQAAVERSRKLMVLFTKNFAKSQWCMYELRLFIMEVQERGEELIVVFLEDIPAEDTTSEMEAASAVYPCYKWPDGARARKKFWKALYKAAIKGTDRDRSVLDKVLKKLFK
ncbi:hypothetical protein BaRGS_00008456 [Batillaria attramentaria]|uniref:TIR domain-containing protein n=1 Tax=Batillaria attramentaria TaxID=370345 RepID=A0ABD0LM21_9CAEN